MNVGSGMNNQGSNEISVVADFLEQLRHLPPINR
jgi:hypothetical protein